jgi:hypothetical protein
VLLLAVVNAMIVIENLRSVTRGQRRDHLQRKVNFNDLPIYVSGAPIVGIGFYRRFHWGVHEHRREFHCCAISDLRATSTDFEGDRSVNYLHRSYDGLRNRVACGQPRSY